VLLHESRHLRAWLIFNVRQIMTRMRYGLFSCVAALITLTASGAEALRASDMTVRFTLPYLSDKEKIPAHPTFEWALEKKLACDKLLRRNESPVQTFYIIKNHTSGDPEYIVYWPEARYIIYVSEPTTWDAISEVSHWSDLEEDVVAFPSERYGSNFFQVAEEAADVIKSCMSGRRLQFFTPPPMRFSL